MTSYVFLPPVATAVARHRAIALRLAAGATLYRLPPEPPATLGEVVEVVADDSGTPLPDPIPVGWVLLAP